MEYQVHRPRPQKNRHILERTVRVLKSTATVKMDIVTIREVTAARKQHHHFVEEVMTPVLF